MVLLLKQLDISNQQIKNYESENTIIIQKEVDKLKYNYDLLLQEKLSTIARISYEIYFSRLSFGPECEL